jgi:pimeloyl-ACP methyl ester carboxylesterase
VNWLLLRGLVREQRHWAGFAERLAARTGAEVRTLDLPGVGSERHRASPTSIAGIVEDLRGRFTPDGEWGLFAPSLGGMIALEWARRHPRDFARVVVCNTSARDLAPPWRRFSPLAIWTAALGVVSRDMHRREARTLQLVSNTTHGRAHAARFAGFALEAPVPKATLFRQLFAASRATAPRRIEVPLLVMCSDGDRLCHPVASRRLADRLGAPIVVHPTGGHDLPLDDPDWVIEHLCSRSGDPL